MAGLLEPSKVPDEGRRIHEHRHLMLHSCRRTSQGSGKGGGSTSFYSLSEICGSEWVTGRMGGIRIGRFLLTSLLVFLRTRSVGEAETPAARMTAKSRYKTRGMMVVD